MKISLEMGSEHSEYGYDTIFGHLETLWEKYTKIWDLARFMGG